jgi:hypothetical protein
MKKLAAPIPRIALSKPEAAASISVGVDFFEEYVAAHLRTIRRGKKVLYPVAELERWVAENAEQSVAEAVAA